MSAEHPLQSLSKQRRLSIGDCRLSGRGAHSVSHLGLWATAEGQVEQEYPQSLEVVVMRASSAFPLTVKYYCTNGSKAKSQTHWSVTSNIILLCIILRKLKKKNYYVVLFVNSLIGYKTLTVQIHQIMWKILLLLNFNYYLVILGLLSIWNWELILWHHIQSYMFLNDVKMVCIFSHLKKEDWQNSLLHKDWWLK